MEDRKKFKSMTPKERVAAYRILVEAIGIDWDTYIAACRTFASYPYNIRNSLLDNTQWIKHCCAAESSLSAVINNTTVWSDVEARLGLPRYTIQDRIYNRASQEAKKHGHIYTTKIDLSPIYRK